VSRRAIARPAAADTPRHVGHVALRVGSTSSRSGLRHIDPFTWMRYVWGVMATHEVACHAYGHVTSGTVALCLFLHPASNQRKQAVQTARQRIVALPREAGETRTRRTPAASPTASAVLMRQLTRAPSPGRHELVFERVAATHEQSAAVELAKRPLVAGVAENQHLSQHRRR
jgi:hypothetical protein